MSRDAIYLIAPKRAGGWRVVKALEHGPHHDRKTWPKTWRGPFASDLDARHAIFDLLNAPSPELAEALADVEAAPPPPVTRSEARAALDVLGRYFTGDASQGLLAELESIFDDRAEDDQPAVNKWLAYTPEMARKSVTGRIECCTKCGQPVSLTPDWTLWPWPDGANLCANCNDERHEEEEYP